MILVSFLVAVLSFLPFGLSTDDAIVHTFPEPIDALSVALPSEDSVVSVSYHIDGEWSDWEDLHIENEQDPTLLESNLVIFPAGVTEIRTKGEDDAITLHPIQISSDPVALEVSATASITSPRILSRKQWGADEELLYRTNPVEQDLTTMGDNGDQTAGTAMTQREKDCQEAQRLYPDEFKTIKRTTKDDDGRTYRWVQEYSPKVKLLVVHHTAITVKGDERSGVERVRALYAYHANNRGWGDIGYHYLVDEDGKIYEGRAGGKGVTGGHAYCNNAGTIGVALLGNFDVEKPTQKQMQSLQWLLSDLAEEYNIDPGTSVTYHGKTMEPIIGHRDLLSTDCPGYYVYGSLSQVRKNVVSGNVNGRIVFPTGSEGYEDKTTARKTERLKKLPVVPTLKEGVSPLGSVALRGRPGTTLLIGVRYQTGTPAAPVGTVVAALQRSQNSIQVWQERNGAFVSATGGLVVPQPLPARGSVQLRLKVQLPNEEGRYTITIGQWMYTIDVSGRPEKKPFVRATSKPTGKTTAQNPLIRIRLTFDGNLVAVDTDDRKNLQMEKVGDICVLTEKGKKVPGTPPRIETGENTFTITSFTRNNNRYHGALECRVIDGKFVLINELPLETYLAGLAEEPDTEPYEKQRAFAIAARTYAAHYLQSTQRKFPGMPYDGDDSPARFQSYAGASYEEWNPHWSKAVRSTVGQVLTKNDTIIRPPYFSSDDGRTRTPEEAGWKSFPFAEIFTSKDDPWCKGQGLHGHGVGMSGCGAEGQALEGKTAEQILDYYYPGTVRAPLLLP